MKYISENIKNYPRAQITTQQSEKLTKTDGRKNYLPKSAEQYVKQPTLSPRNYIFRQLICNNKYA